MTSPVGRVFVRRGRGDDGEIDVEDDADGCCRWIRSLWVVDGFFVQIGSVEMYVCWSLNVIS